MHLLLILGACLGFSFIFDDDANESTQNAGDDAHPKKEKAKKTKTIKAAASV